MFIISLASILFYRLAHSYKFISYKNYIVINRLTVKPHINCINFVWWSVHIHIYHINIIIKSILAM